MSQLHQDAPRFSLRPLLIGSGALLLVAGLAVAAMVGLRYENGAETSAAPVIKASLPVPAKPPEKKPGFDIVRVSPQGTAVIAGTAAPDQTVVVRDGTRELGRTTADHAGQWVLTPDKPLEPGAREITLASRGPDGTETASGASVVLVVPNSTDVTGSKPLAVLTPTAPGAPARVLQAPGAGGKTARLDLDIVDYDDHGAITFSGHAPPSVQLKIYVDNVPVAGATAGPDASWSVAPGGIAPGQHRVRVDQVDAKGRVVSRVELPFQRETLPAATLAGGHVIVQPGENLWRIARQAYGNGGRYTVIYAYNSSQIRNPALIYPGQAFVIPDAATAAAIPPAR